MGMAGADVTTKAAGFPPRLGISVIPEHGSLMLFFFLS